MFFILLFFFLFVDVFFDMVAINHRLYGGIQNRIWVGVLYFITCQYDIVAFWNYNNNTYYYIYIAIHE